MGIRRRGVCTWGPGLALLLIVVLTLPVWAQSLEEFEKLHNEYSQLSEQRRYREAIPLAHRMLAIAEKTMGPEHPATAFGLHTLAALHRLLGEYTQAEPLFKRALSIAEKTLGPEHPDLAIILAGLAGLYDDIGDHAQAEPLKKRVKAILGRAEQRR